MLSALAKDELEKTRREAKTDRFLKGLGVNRPVSPFPSTCQNRQTSDPIEEAKSFIHNLVTNSELQVSAVDLENEEVTIRRKPKKINLEKQMAIELEKYVCT